MPGIRRTQVISLAAVLVTAAAVLGFLGPGSRTVAAQESATAAQAAPAVSGAAAAAAPAPTPPLQSPEERKNALMQEGAKNTYLAVRPYIARYAGFVVFLIMSLILISFLRRRIEQREYLRGIGFLETPEIEPEIEAEPEPEKK